MSAPWYEGLTDGTVVPLAFLKIDLEGSTDLRRRLSADEMTRAMAWYRTLVEEAMAGIAALPDPPQWAGDGQAFVAGGERPIAAMVEAALGLLRDVRTYPDAELHVRIAIGFDDVPFRAQVGTIKATEFDFAGHLEHVCPRDSVLLTEEAYLALRGERPLSERFEYFGMRADDRCPAFVAPLGRPRVESKHAELLIPEDADTYRCRRRLLNLYDEPAFRQIRFIGVRQFERIGGVELLDAFRPLRVRFESRRWEARGLGAWPPLVPDEVAKRDDGTLDIVEVRSEGRHFDLAGGGKGTVWEPVSVLIESRTPLVETVQDFLAVLRYYRHLVVLGDPGSGKSTLLRWLALVAAQGRRIAGRVLGLRESSFPLHFSIGRLASLVVDAGSNSPDETLAEYFRSRGVPDALGVISEALGDGSALLLFDGLDEVPSADDRRAVERFIELLCSQHPNCRVVVTSRSVGYVPLSIGESETWALEPLDALAAQGLAEAFYTAYYRVEYGAVGKAASKGASEAASLIGALAARPSLEHFRENPLLLTLAALVHTQMGRLPRYRARLYQVAAQTLIEAWATARLAVPALHPIQPIEYDVEGLTVFPALALELHEHHAGGLIGERDLLAFISARLRLPKDLDGTDRLAAARNLLQRVTAGGSILIERGSGQWGFLHQTIQEYLAAKALADDQSRRTAVLAEHLFDPRFEEVWRLVAGEIGIVHESPMSASRFIAAEILQESDGLYSHALRKDLLLAAACLADTSINDVALFDRLIEGIADAALSPWDCPPQEAVDAALRELAALPDDVAGLAAKLFEHIASPDAQARRLAVRALTTLRVPDGARAASLLSGDPDAAVKAAAAHWLGTAGAKVAVAPLVEVFRRSAFERAGGLEVMWACAAALEEIADPDITADLTAALHASRDQRSARLLATALYRAGARDALLKEVGAGQGLVAGAAVAVLAENGVTEALPAIAEALGLSSDKDFAVAAALASAQLGSSAGLHELRRLVGGPSTQGWNYWSAVRALGRVGKPSDAALLVSVLRSSDSDMARYEAALALGRLGLAEGARPVYELACDSQAGILARLGAIRSLPRLLPHPVAAAALEALVRADAHDTVQSEAARALGAMRSTGSVDALFGALAAPASPRLQGAAAVALAALPNAEIPPRALKLLRDSRDERTWYFASRILAAHGEKAAVDIILERRLHEWPLAGLPAGLPPPHSYGQILWILGLQPPYRTPVHKVAAPRRKSRAPRAKPTRRS